MALISVAEDILLQLTRHLSNKDLLSTMSTCRVLFRIGLPALLGRDIFLTTSTAIRPFYDFLLIAAPLSFECLRSLSVSTPPWDIEKKDRPWADALDTILMRACNLQTLSIHAALLHGIDTCEANNVVYLEHLRHLTIFEMEELFIPLGFLSALNSPLTHLRLDIEMEDPIEDIMLAVAEFSHTLQEFTFSCLSYSMPTLPFSHCEKVERLTIAPFTWPHWLPYLMTMFPNVRTLIVEDAVDIDLEEEDDLIILRKENILFQTAHPSWNSLDIVQADYVGLYAMALQCEVSSLEVTTPLLSNHSISDPLRPLRPRHLRVTVQPDLDDVEWAIPVSGVDRLERLDVTIKLHFSISIDKCAKAAVRLIKRNNRLCIRMLSFQFKAPDLDLSSEMWAPLDKRTWRKLFLALAKRAAETIPTLQFAKFTVVVPGQEASPAYPQVYCTIQREKGIINVRQVPREDDAAIRSINRMHVPPAAWEN